VNLTQHQPWLFDNRDAWQRAIADSRWSYDLPMSRFMAIYNEYRGSNKGTQSPMPFTPKPTITMSSSIGFSAPAPVAAPPPAPPSAASGAGQILSQSEIDSLLNLLG